jgi:putative membrane protein
MAMLSTVAFGDNKVEPAKFLGDAIQDGQAEISLYKMALRTSLNPLVQGFAERMILEHDELDRHMEALAQRKGYKLSGGSSVVQHARFIEFKALSGHGFDKVFFKHSVAEHQRNLQRFAEQAQQSSDADVRAFAASALPILNTHLYLAEEGDADVHQ